MPAPYLILIMVGVAVATAAALHFLTHRRVLQAAEHKAVHLICSECSLLVARYRQMKDASIKCVNCLRRAERKR